MTTSIKLSRLEDLCSLVTDGTHDSPKLLANGVPFIKGKHISSGTIDFENCDYISEADHLKVIARSKPELGDTLFSNIGSVGDAAFVNTTREFSIKNVALFKPDRQKVDPRYLFYLMRSHNVVQGLLAHRSGSAQPFIGLSTLRGFEVAFHGDLTTQRRIASILSAYDDLIENNTRRIAILEEMARRLYEEWFVHFHFPGHEEVEFDGELPVGWSEVSVEDFGDVVTGKTPSKKRPEFFNGDIPFLRLPDMHGNVFVTSTSDTLTEAGANSQRNKFIPSGSLCVSCIGTVGIVVITSEPCQTNQQINSLVLYDDCAREFMFFALKSLKDTIERYAATGATMANLSRGKFASLRLVRPTEQIIAQFHELAFPMLNAILKLQQKNANLRAQRDMLLPKLVSGEIDVSEAENAMEAAE